MSTHAAANPGPLPTDAEGFAFLQGEWKVAHKKLKEPLSGKKEEWNEFSGGARFITLLDGLISVEELMGADGKPYGGALRSFDRERRVWKDSWIPYGSGVPQPPTEGRFKDGVGNFIAPDEWNGKPILARGLWKRLSADVVTWEQAASLDNGKTWETNWFMRFERIKP